jgi:hypothetical protein
MQVESVDDDFRRDGCEQPCGSVERRALVGQVVFVQRLGG